VPEPFRAAESEGPRGLDEVRVRAADSRVDVQVEREGHAERDQHDLGFLADAEPQDEQRDQAEERQGAQHLHGRVDQRFAPAGKPGDDAQQHTDDGADREPGADAPERHRERGPEFAAARDFDAGLHHRPR